MMVSKYEVLVVGGGTAGWLTAAVIAAERRALGDTTSRVTLVESPDIPTMGVGEGTWPSMRATLQAYRAQRIRTVTVHPSELQAGYAIRWLVGAGRRRHLLSPLQPSGQRQHPESGSLLAALRWKKKLRGVCHTPACVIERGLAPKQIDTPEYAFAVNYAYHLDAGKFAELLKEHAVARLGVRHLRANVEQIVGTKGHDIEALKLDSGERLEADLFIDCTGQRALLLDGHMGVKRVKVDQVLFNDSAIAVQVPHAFEDTPIASATISTATKIGWIWDIAFRRVAA